MGDGAQPREQALVQHLLEVPLTDVLKGRLVHVRWPSTAQHGPAQPGKAWPGIHPTGYPGSPAWWYADQTSQPAV